MIVQDSVTPRAWSLGSVVIVQDRVTPRVWSIGGVMIAHSAPLPLCATRKV